MALELARKTGESWREAAIHVAKQYGLEGEVGDAYQKYIEEGDSEEDAAWAACYDWDVLAFVDGDRPSPGGSGSTS